MLSVQEVCRRRRENSRDPFGLYRTDGKHYQLLEKMPLQKINTNICQQKINAFANEQRSLGFHYEKRESTSHMMPILKVVEKRTRGKDPPPGFPRKTLIDLNNNSGEKSKKNVSGNKAGEKSSSVRNDDDGKYTITPNQEKKSKVFTNCLHGVKSELSELFREEEDIQPPCLEEEKDTSKRKPNKEKAKNKAKSKVGKLFNMFKKKQQTRDVATTFETDIAGEAVTVNILPINNEENTILEFDERHTPDNYEETFAYFESITEARTNLFKCLYVLGDMLLAHELDGDMEDWKHFLEKLDAETIAWREKCKRSDEYFAKTRKIIGQDETLCQRLFRGIRTKAANTFHMLTEICPLRCFGT